jgi:hypothetical protein
MSSDRSITCDGLRGCFNVSVESHPRCVTVVSSSRLVIPAPNTVDYALGQAGHA